METREQNIIHLAKILYPCAHPVVRFTNPNKGKVVCSVYLNEFAVENGDPFCISFLRNSIHDAENDILALLEQKLLERFDSILARSASIQKYIASEQERINKIEKAASDVVNSYRKTIKDVHYLLNNA